MHFKITPNKQKVTSDVQCSAALNSLSQSTFEMSTPQPRLSHKLAVFLWSSAWPYFQEMYPDSDLDSHAPPLREFHQIPCGSRSSSGFKNRGSGIPNRDRRRREQWERAARLWGVHISARPPERITWRVWFLTLIVYEIVFSDLFEVSDDQFTARLGALWHFIL